MIAFALELVLKTKKRRDEVVRIASSILQPTRVQAGCTRCEFYQGVKDKDHLFFAEEWSTEADLKKHIRSPEFRKILAMMDLSDNPPEVRFHTAGGIRGIDFVEETLNENV